MVTKHHIRAVGIAAAVILLTAALYWCNVCFTARVSDRNVTCGCEGDKDCGSSVPSEDIKLTCSHVFQEIGDACSRQQYEEMEKLFIGISNKVEHIGSADLDSVTSPVKEQTLEFFLCVNRGGRDFATVSEFERYMKTNIAAVKIVGFAIAANNVYDTALLQYDAAVFRATDFYVKKFRDSGNLLLSQSAALFLDSWKKYLESGESLTRKYLRHQYLRSLKCPRWLAEDMGMKTSADWSASSREHALKFHKQQFGIVPTWIDDDYPVVQNSDGGIIGQRKR